jgi:hypothetical protein
MNTKKTKYNHMERRTTNEIDIPGIALKAARELSIENKETIEKGWTMYQFLQSKVKNEDFKNNKENNILLLKASMSGALTNTLPFWRFVCMPEIELNTENGKFKKPTLFYVTDKEVKNV